MTAFIDERACRERTVGLQKTTAALCGRKIQKPPNAAISMKTTSRIILSAVALTATALFATAQDNNNQNRDNRGQGGTPEEFRARMAERLKTSLKVTDDEWAVLQPLIEKVTTKQRESMAGRFGGFGGRGGGGPGGGNNGGGDRGGSAESQALREALDKDGASAEDIKAKLNAVRESRKKATAELATAREDLKKVVSVRQEAVLFSMGILE